VLAVKAAKSNRNAENVGDLGGSTMGIKKLHALNVMVMGRSMEIVRIVKVRVL
jgi:hypothetical protein